LALYQMMSRALVRISGEDAKKLCNDTLTCRFEGLGAGTGRWFALLSPQGKVLVEGLVSLEDGAYWFDLDAGLVADFIKRMKMYRLRAKADIVEVEDRAVLWSPDEDLPPRGMPIAVRDERSPALGIRYIVDRADIGEAARGGEEAYATARIGAGIMALGPDFAANEMFPHDLGMDFLSGLDFKKGCYIGQEVVSRMQHRGTARRRPVIVAGLPDGAAPGAPLLLGEREIGTIGAMQSGHAVALVRLDRVSDPHAASFAGLPVDLRLPAWAGYGFGGAGGEE
jgi:folate-binding protein YgfZ